MLTIYFIDTPCRRAIDFHCDMTLLRHFIDYAMPRRYDAITAIIFIASHTATVSLITGHVIFIGHCID
jgi:hypothetical protein